MVEHLALKMQLMVSQGDGKATHTLGEIVDKLENTYCQGIGYAGLRGVYIWLRPCHAVYMEKN